MAVGTVLERQKFPYRTPLVSDNPLGVHVHLFDSCSPRCGHNQTRGSTTQPERAAPFYKDIDLRIRKHTAPACTASWTYTQLEAPHS